MSGTKRPKASIVIRREEIVEGGHHGGAWKVAYADFVTAMMAFFLLMWLLNATTQEQRRGLADYFGPSNNLSRTTSGFGEIFGGLTPNSEGSLASDRGAVEVVHSKTIPLVDATEDGSDEQAMRNVVRRSDSPVRMTAPDPSQPELSGQQPAPPDAEAVRAEAKRQERERFERAAEQLREAVAQDPALAELSRQLAIDLTPEGLRIQILDEEKRSMFATGSSVLNERARALLAKIAPVLMRLPESVSINGHTDAAPYRSGERGNWDLAADRANATRRFLAESGLPEARIHSVTGHADHDLLLPAEPLAAANRRIAIVVLHAQRPAPEPLVREPRSTQATR